MKKFKLEKRFIDELKKLGITEISEENSYDIHTQLLSLDGYLGNLNSRTKEIQDELDTIWDLLNFWDDIEDNGDSLDYEWINKELKK